MTVLPETPVQAAIAVCAPMRTLCAIWIRLSSFTPSSSTVSPMAPRSMVVLAPISTSAPTRTAADLRHLQPRAAHRGKAEAVTPDHRPRLHHRAGTDLHPGAERHAGHQAHVLRERHARIQHALRADEAARTDASRRRRSPRAGPPARWHRCVPRARRWRSGEPRARAPAGDAGARQSVRRWRRGRRSPARRSDSRPPPRRSAPPPSPWWRRAGSGSAGWRERSARRHRHWRASRRARPVRQDHRAARNRSVPRALQAIPPWLAQPRPGACVALTSACWPAPALCSASPQGVRRSHRREPAVLPAPRG